MNQAYRPLHRLGDDLTPEAALRLQLNKLIEVIEKMTETGATDHDEQPNFDEHKYLSEQSHQSQQVKRTGAQDASRHDGSAALAPSSVPT